MNLQYGGIMVLYALLLGIILYKVGSTPPALDLVTNQRKSKWIIGIMFSIQIFFLTVSIFVLNPFFTSIGIDYFFISILLTTILFVIIPIIITKYDDNWPMHNLGFSLRSMNLDQKKLIIIAIVGYLGYGILRIIFLPPNYFYWWVIALMLYSNAFIEEFFNRSFIQSRLESLYGPKKALFWQTVLFTIIHIPSNIMRYQLNPDIGELIIYFLFQAIHGTIYGILFWKTRSIYPSILVHFLTNWMGPLFFLFF